MENFVRDQISVTTTMIENENLLSHMEPKELPIFNCIEENRLPSSAEENQSIEKHDYIQISFFDLFPDIFA